MKEYVEDSGTYKIPNFTPFIGSLYIAFSLYEGPGVWKNSELSPHIGSGTWEYTAVHPQYRLWYLEERSTERSEVQVVVYSFLPI